MGKNYSDIYENYKKILCEEQCKNFYVKQWTKKLIKKIVKEQIKLIYSLEHIKEKI